MNQTLEWQVKTVAKDDLSEKQGRTAKLQTPAQLQEAAALGQHDDFWSSMSALADLCDEILSKAGLPKVSQVVRHDGQGNWWPTGPEDKVSPAPGEIRKFETGWRFVCTKHDDLSEVWYAAQIGFKCREAIRRWEKANNNSAWFCAAIFEIASLRTDWQWRYNYKRPILAGRPILNGLDAGRGVANANARQRAKDRQDAIRQMLPTFRVGMKGAARENAIRRRLLDEGFGEVSARTIRRDLAQVCKDKNKVGHTG